MGLSLEAPEQQGQQSEEICGEAKAAMTQSSLEAINVKEGETNAKHEAEGNREEDLQPYRKESDEAEKSAKSMNAGANKPKKKKKNSKKKNSDGTSTKKLKKKKKKRTKGKAKAKEESTSMDATKGDVSSNQAVPKDTVEVIPNKNLTSDVAAKDSFVVEATKQQGSKPQLETCDSPLIYSKYLSSPTKQDTSPDTESIYSKLSDFENAWGGADHSRHREMLEEEKEEEYDQREQPVPLPEEEVLSLAETILDSTASASGSTFAPHGQYDVISTTMKTDEKAIDVRRQAISLAAAETRRRAEARTQSLNDKTELSNQRSVTINSRNNSIVNWRHQDDDDGTEQPVSASSNTRIANLRSQAGKMAYMEGVKAESILDVKGHQPGAFCVTGSGDAATDPADDENVVVSAVTPEDEAQIEERVMQRFLKETAQAAVILVEHGGNSKKYEDPIAEAERRAELENFKPQGLREMMFGDGKNASMDVGTAPDDYIQRRNHLPWTVKLHGTTNLWVASVQTNQKAWEPSQYMYEKTSLELKRSIQTFIGTTEQEAYEIGLALAPPIMHTFDENPICALCNSKFALLKRPCHCRNCGIVVCSGCSCSWSSKQIPATYNMEKRSNVNVCLACDWLATSFREALLQGDLKGAQLLYQTGNVNLRTLYGAKKKSMMGDEAMSPIHMAIRGDNLSLVKWLMFEHYCPLYQSNTTGKERSLLKTSKGRTVIDMALEQSKPEILKFLVTNQGLSLMEGAKKENRDSLNHLMCLIQLIPEVMLENITIDSDLPPKERTEEVPESSLVGPGEGEDQCAF